MCMNTPNIPAPVEVVERQAARSPDGAAVAASGRRTMDRVRAGANTILTSGSGVSGGAATQGKTLLGQ